MKNILKKIKKLIILLIFTKKQREYIWSLIDIDYYESRHHPIYCRVEDDRDLMLDTQILFDIKIDKNEND